MADDHGTGKVTHMGAMRTWTEIDGEWFYKNGVPCVSDPYNIIIKLLIGAAKHTAAPMK